MARVNIVCLLAHTTHSMQHAPFGEGLTRGDPALVEGQLGVGALPPGEAGGLVVVDASQDVEIKVGSPPSRLEEAGGMGAEGFGVLAAVGEEEVEQAVVVEGGLVDLHGAGDVGQGPGPDAVGLGGGHLGGNGARRWPRWPGWWAGGFEPWRAKGTHEKVESVDCGSSLRTPSAYISGSDLLCMTLEVQVRGRNGAPLRRGE